MKKLGSYLWRVGTVLILSGLLISCGGKGGGNAAPAPVTTPTTTNGGTDTLAPGQTKLSGAVQGDPNDSVASGANSGATVYVVGQEKNATKTDSDGNYSVTVDPVKYWGR